MKVADGPRHSGRDDMKTYHLFASAVVAAVLAVAAPGQVFAGHLGGGLVPGWGGCGEMLARWQSDPKLPRGPMPAPAKVFEGISTADGSKSTHQAQEKKFLRET